MILWMLYATVLTLLLGTAAAALEAPAVRAGKPIRLPWLAALVVGAAMGLGAPLLSAAAPATPGVGRSAGLPQGAEAGGNAAMHAGAADAAGDVIADLTRRTDRPLAAAWAIATSLLGFGLATAAIRLRALKSAGMTRHVGGVRLVFHAERGPAAGGVLEPWVMLPAWCRGLPPNQRRLMIAHELEHVRSGDPLMKLAGTCALVLMPWNPAAWWALRRLDLAIEVDCDTRVVQRCGRVSDYARFLLDVASGARRVPFLAVGEVHLSGNLERRVLVMTKRTHSSGSRLAIRAAVATAAVAGVFALEVPARPAFAQDTAAGAITGVVLDQNGAPVGDVQVSIGGSGGGSGTGMLTNVEGRFLLPSVAPGQYDLRVVARGYRSQAVNEVDVAAGGATRLTITLSRIGEPPVPVIQESADAMTARPADAAAAARPATDVVTARPADVAAAARPATAVMTARPADAAAAARPAAASALHAITGTVTDPAGSPLGRVEIRVAGTDLGTLTNVRGRFLLLLEEAGTRSLIVSAPGYRTVELSDVPVKAGEPGRVEIVLQPSGG